MKRLQQLLALPKTSRNILLQAVFLLFFTKLTLRWVTFERLRGRAGRYLRPPTGGPPDWRTVRVVAWAVDRASIVTGGTCLTKAFVGEWLLRRRGLAVDLRVGVARDDNGGLDAHAWLEVEGRTIIGEVDEMSRFSTFSTLDASATGSS